MNPLAQKRLWVLNQPCKFLFWSQQLHSGRMKWGRKLPFHGESAGVRSYYLSVIMTHIDRSSPLHFVDAEGELKLELYRGRPTWIDLLNRQSPNIFNSVSESRDCSDGECICMSIIIKPPVKLFIYSLKWRPLLTTRVHHPCCWSIFICWTTPRGTEVPRCVCGAYL